MSELVSPYCAQTVFLNLRTENPSETPEKIELTIEKNYPLLSKDSLSKAWIALDRLRITATAGDKSIYYTETTDDEWIRTVHDTHTEFNIFAADKNDAGKIRNIMEWNRFVGSTHTLADITYPSHNVRMRMLPTTDNYQNRPVVGVFVRNIRNMIIERGHLLHEGSPVGWVNKSGDEIASLTLWALRSVTGEPDVVLPRRVLKVLEEAAEYNDFYDEIGYLSDEDGNRNPLDGFDEPTHDTIVYRRNEPTKRYVIEEIIEEKQAYLKTSIINEAGNIAAFRPGSLPTDNLTVLRTTGLIAPTLSGGQSVETNQIKFRKGVFQFIIQKDNLDEGGWTAEDLAASLRKWDISLYGVQAPLDRADCEVHCQFRCGFRVGAKALTGPSVGNGTNDLDIGRVGEAFNTQLNQITPGTVPAQHCLAANEYGVLEINGIPLLNQADDGVITETNYFSEKTLAIGDVLKVLKLAGNGDPSEDTWEITSFVAMYSWNAENENYTFYFSPVGNFHFGVGGFIRDPTLLVGYGGTVASVDSWYLDPPYMGLERNADGSPVITQNASGVNQYEYTRLFQHEVYWDVGLNTRMSEIVALDNDDSFQPICGERHLFGSAKRFSMKKFIYNPNELFDVFRSDEIQFGVSNDGTFMVSIPKGTSEVHVSKAFIDKYDLNTFTGQMKTNKRPSTDERFVTFLQRNTLNDTNFPHPYFATLTGDSVGDEGTFYWFPGNPNQYLVKKVSLNRTHLSQVTEFSESTPAELVGGDYYLFRPDPENDRAIFSKGDTNLETLSEFTELVVSGSSPAFQSQLGIGADHRVLFSIELPNKYSITASTDRLKPCKLQYEALSDLIVHSLNDPQYLRISSVADMRFASFYVERIDRAGGSSFCFLPKGGIAILKIRMYVGK